jgi:hypothetical protein
MRFSLLVRPASSSETPGATLLSCRSVYRARLVGISFRRPAEHTMNNPADQTALGPMVIVAAEQYEPSPLIRRPLHSTGRSEE